MFVGHLPAGYLATAGLLHLALDTLVGGIRWLSPFQDDYTTLVEVPARYPHWLLSFLLHWTFGLELLFVALVAVLYWRHRKGRALRGYAPGG